MKSFRKTAKIGLPIFQLPIFILSREKCQHQSHWIRNFRLSFLYIGFEPHYLSAIRILLVLAAIIRESSHKLTCVESHEGFGVHSSIWPSRAKAEWYVSTELIGYINTWIWKRSSQLWTLLLSSSKKKAWKKFRPVRDLNPWPLWYRCSAQPTELTSQLRAGHCVGSN